MRFATVFLVAFACTGAFASEPGQPLDCSDWVSIQPGFVCSEFLAYPADPDRSWLGQRELVPDNEGFMLTVRRVPIPSMCHGNQLSRTELLRYRENEEQVVGYFADRCSHDSLGFQDASVLRDSSPILRFDGIGGRAMLSLQVFCYGCSETSERWYPPGFWVPAISGFAKTFDVLQTYTPQPAALGFRVPYMPEGMAAVDHFDTYWGNLAHPIDFTQAHPMQCDYPSAPPHVGDYLTVADTVPAPAPGQGVYYVTAATYQGATRYGRKTTAGHLSGRDPAVLPACIPQIAFSRQTSDER